MNYMMMNQIQIQQHQQQELFRQQQQMFQQQQQDAMNMQMNDEIMQQQLNLNDFLNYYNYMTRVSPNPFKTSLECVTEGKKINKALVKTGQFLLGSKGLGNPAYVSFKSKAIYTLAVRDGNKYIRDANAAIKKGNKTEALKNLKAAKACFEKAIKSVRDGANSHTLYEKVYGDMITGGLMSYLSDTFRTFRAAKELKEYGEFGESWGKELKKQGVLKIINVFTLGFSGYHVFKKRRKVNRDADKVAGTIDKTKLNQFKNDTLYLLRVYLQVVNEMIANLEGKNIPTKENYTMDMYDADIIYENLMEIIDEPVTESLDINTKKKLDAFVESHDVDYSSYLVNNAFIKSAESIMGVTFGKSVKAYILQYGYLGYGHIELFGINSKQGMKSDMIKETLNIHEYYPVTKDMIAIENQGDGDYYLVDSHDKVYELNRDTEKLVSTGLDFYSYILERFNQIDGSDSAYENLNASYTCDDKIDELLESAF